MAIPLTFNRPKAVVNALLARWMIYSRYGRGKTTFLASIPPDLPVHLVNTPTENIKPVSHLDHFTATPLVEWDQMKDLFLLHRGKTMMKDRKTGFYVPDPDYVEGRSRWARVLAFDTLSKLQALAAMKARGIKVDPDEAYELMVKLQKSGKDYNFWDNVGDMVTEAVNDFNQLPLHTIWLAQEEDKDPRFEHSSPTVTGPMLTPKALKGVMPIVELAGRLVVASESSDEDSLEIRDSGTKSYEINTQTKEVRWLLLGQHDRYLTKGPTHVLGYAIRNPTWAKLAVSLDPAKMAVPIEEVGEDE